MIDCNNVLVLAYIGDAVYEVYIRNYLIKKNIVKVDKLQKEAVKYVSAKSQRVFLEKLINQNFFNQEEIAIIKRSRNHKGNRHPKNTDIITYKYATAFEAIIGYFYLTNNKKLDEMMNLIYDEDGR
ncbi:MAG: ribonuclease III [Firmicutes bacterium]|nr:ribonuclease III [Bacillota bacterium]